MIGPRRATLLAAIAALAATAAACAAGDARAQTLGLGGQDNRKPIGIEAQQGIEWQQNSHVYIARGKVKATRGDATLFADTLYAYYRPSAQPAGDAQKREGVLGGDSTEIYRIEADGNVRFGHENDTVYGDHAVYDVDQAIVVVTGKDLKMVTPRDTVTARDSLEWYDNKQLAVARGDAVVVRETKRLRGDVLTAEVVRPANQAARITRIDAQGNVVVSTVDQIAHGDSGVYNVDTGIATLAGHVKLTRADNELRGQYAVVDLNKNVSRLLSAPPSAKSTTGSPTRVEGLLVPRGKPGAAQ